jgi:hypothetical protein
MTPEINFRAGVVVYQEGCNTSGIANFGFCCLGHLGSHPLPYLPENLGQSLIQRKPICPRTTSLPSVGYQYRDSTSKQFRWQKQMSFNVFRKRQSDNQPNSNDDYSNIKEEIMRELLRQVRQSYNLALAVTTASALMTLSGVGLLYFNKLPEASLTTAGGVLASLHSVQLAKEAKEELRQMMDED